MKLNKPNGKNIFVIFSILMVLLFLYFRLSNIYFLSGDEQSGELGGSRVKTFYSKVNSECIEKATRWLINLSVDPLELDKKGMKGKKHFVEKLFIFYQLYLHTADSEKKAIYKKILRQMFKITDKSDYHLLGSDESNFKSDILSYVHACYLMKQLGFDSYNYKRHIREILPRIEKHIPRRNTSIQMMLIYLLRGLGFQTEHTIEQLFKNTLIHNIKQLGVIDIFDFKYNSYMLGICHEIFVISGYGGKKIDLLTKEEKDYLQTIFKSSIEKILSSRDLRYLDLLAEILVSLKYLGCDNLPEFNKGIQFIINHQNKNGSFGDYEGFREYFAKKGIDIDIKWYLHTTEVCLWAMLMKGV